MRIGELLIMNGLVTAEQVEHALEQQKQSHKKIGEIMVEQGVISELQLAEALDFQLGIPVVHCADSELDKDTINLVHESMVRNYCMIPLERKNDKIRLAMADPTNDAALKDVQMSTGLIAVPLLALRSELEQAIIKHYGPTEHIEKIDKLLHAAVDKQASEIHITPDEEGLKIKFRIDRKLCEETVIPNALKDQSVDYIKSLSKLFMTERSIPQTGSFQKQIADKPFAFHVFILPTASGERLLIRIKSISNDWQNNEKVDLRDENYDKVKKALQLQKGLLLISGPVESGKSATLHRLPDILNDHDWNVLSVENKIEQAVKGFAQIELNERKGWTFSNTWNHILQQQPDLVLVDLAQPSEYMETIARSSLDGYLISASINGNDTVHTILKLLNFGFSPVLIASSLTLIVSQKLVRRVCDKCAHSIPITDEEIKHFEAYDLLNREESKSGSKGFIGNFRTFVAAHISGKMTLIKGSGCKACNNSGYNGYVAIHEVLEVDETIRKLILENQPESEFRQYLKQINHQSMLYDGLWKAREGMTTIDEVLRRMKDDV